MKSLKYYITQTFLRHILLALGIVLVLMFLMFSWLKIYTRHGQAIEVPDFTGMTSEEVQELCRDMRLKYEVIDCVFYRTHPKGTVVAQIPMPKDKVKKGRRIFLTMNAKRSEMVQVPNVENVSLVQAIADLETKGLMVGKLIYVEHFAQHYVLKQKRDGKRLAPGSMLEKGSFVDLELGRGEAPETTTGVPSLKTMTLRDARKRITEAYLNTGRVNYDNTIKQFGDSTLAFVYKQSPSRGIAAAFGAKVDLWLTLDKSKLLSTE